jgi:hypothetical protein
MLEDFQRKLVNFLKNFLINKEGIRLLIIRTSVEFAGGASGSISKMSAATSARGSNYYPQIQKGKPKALAKGKGKNAARTTGVEVMRVISLGRKELAIYTVFIHGETFI